MQQRSIQGLHHNAVISLPLGAALTLTYLHIDRGRLLASIAGAAACLLREMRIQSDMLR